MSYNTYRLYGYVKETETVDKRDIIIVVLIWIFALVVAIGGITYMNYTINNAVNQNMQYQQQRQQAPYYGS